MELRASDALPWIVATEARHPAETSAASLVQPAFERALHQAARHGEVATVERLLGLCADDVSLSIVDARAADGATMLLIASLRGEDDLARLLLAHGASPDRPSTGGLTPLLAAALHCHVDVLRRLIEAGAARSGSLLPTATDVTPILARSGHSPTSWDAATLFKRLHSACAREDEVSLVESLLDGSSIADVDPPGHARKRQMQQVQVRRGYAPGEEVILAMRPGASTSSAFGGGGGGGRGDDGAGVPRDAESAARRLALERDALR